MSYFLRHKRNKTPFFMFWMCLRCLKFCLALWFPKWPELAWECIEWLLCTIHSTFFQSSTCFWGWIPAERSGRWCSSLWFCLPPLFLPHCRLKSRQVIVSGTQGWSSLLACHNCHDFEFPGFRGAVSADMSAETFSTYPPPLNVFFSCIKILVYFL